MRGPSSNFPNGGGPMRLSFGYILFLCVSLGVCDAAFACDDGETTTCTQNDGKPGLKACIQGKWSSCGVAGGGSGIQTGSSSSPANCPSESERTVTYITKGNGDTPAGLRVAVKTPNRLVLIAPDVTIDFTGVGLEENQSVLVPFEACVTLASFDPRKGLAPGNVFVSARTPSRPGPLVLYGACSSDPRDHRCVRKDDTPLFGITCTSGTSADGARIAGFRVQGPSDEDHTTGETGISIEGCQDVEISNTEIHGWGGQAISVGDQLHFGNHTIPDAKQAPSPILVKIHDNYIHHNQHSSMDHHAAGYGVNAGSGAFADIYQNVFDYNRHSITAGWSVGGYHARHNLFLKGGGYHASPVERDIHIVDVHGRDNCVVDDIPGDWPTFVGGSGFWGGIVGGLIGSLLGLGLAFLIGVGSLGFGLLIVGGLLLGGAYGGIAPSTHSLYNCGPAGFSFLIDQNAFQYKKTNDIKIRGTPAGTGSNKTRISFNVFARGNRDDAIGLKDSDAVDVRLNMYDTDTFGQYGVCDIDGDGVDDLVLMTGVNWWFSSGGVHPWTFLKRDIGVLQDVSHGNFALPGDVKLGDFDGDGRCDALRDGGGGAWLISRGAVEDWQSFGNYLAPLRDTHFGRFNPQMRDHRAGVHLPLTDVFWRSDDGFWFVTPLGHPELWQLVGSSSFAMSDLRFGDFTGDAVTDVFAVERGHWAFSESARAQWQTLNSALSDPVNRPNIFVANVNARDNIDDVLRLNQIVDSSYHPGTTKVQLTWNRSENGVEGTWSELKSYPPWEYPSDNPDFLMPQFGFVGYFGMQPFGATMTIDQNRVGHFFSPAQSPPNPTEWTSEFAY